MYPLFGLHSANVIVSRTEVHKAICYRGTFDDTSLLSKMLKGLSLLRRMIRCSPQSIRWIVAGGYLLPSFSRTSITKRDSHFPNSSASLVFRTSAGQRSSSLQTAFLSLTHSSKARKAQRSFFPCSLVKHPWTPPLALSMLTEERNECASLAVENRRRTNIRPSWTRAFEMTIIVWYKSIAAQVHQSMEFVASCNYMGARGLRPRAPI